eukprot:m.94675 g.94675  ORF g.94675 m.94675 type:complete len:51 (-) comp14733_c1_seq1:34-186(-)
MCSRWNKTFYVVSDEQLSYASADWKPCKTHRRYQLSEESIFTSFAFFDKN